MLVLQTRPTTDSASRRIRVQIGFLVFLLFITTLCAEFPQYGGWDVAAYMAIVRPDHSHDAVYKELRKSIPPSYYDELVGKSLAPFVGSHPGDVGVDYRRDMASNADHFAQQLPVYRVKCLYPLLIWTLWKLGVGLYSAAHWVSVVAFFGMGLVVWRWLYLQVPGWLSAIFAATIIIQPAIVQAARSALPDALSIFLVLAGSYFLWGGRTFSWLGHSLLLLSVAARPDNLVFCFVALAATRKWAWCCGALGLYLSIAQFTGFATSWGWSKTFYHGFVHQLYAPAETTVQITRAIYVSAVRFSAVNLLLHSGFLIFTVLAVWGLLCGQRKSRLPIAVCLGTMFLHYLMFPDQTDRFFAAQYAIILTLTASWYILGGGHLVKDRGVPVCYSRLPVNDPDRGKHFAPENRPAVSVGIPAYNCERTLAASVQSILNQTFENWELLIVDDGSTDRTIEVAQSFQDERIRVIADGKHKGLVARLNQAVALSRGEYFARMDGDDLAYPERLERQVDYLEKHPEVDLVGCSMLVFGEDGETLGCRTSPETHEALCRRPSAGFHIWHPTWMGRMEWFRTHRYDPKAIRAEDQVLLLRSYLTSRFACLPEILQGYQESKLFLGKILRGRFTFTVAACREFLMRKQYVTAIECALEQFAKANLDLFAISSGLNHKILRHRARPVAAEIATRWSEVWTQVNT